MRKTFKNTECQNCGSQTKSGALFCSQLCEDEYGEYVTIEIPDRYAKNVLSSLHGSELIEELKKYSKRHEYRLSLLIKKVRIKFGIVI